MNQNSFNPISVQRTSQEWHLTSAGRGWECKALKPLRRQQQQQPPPTAVTCWNCWIISKPPQSYLENGVFQQPSRPIRLEGLGRSVHCDTHDFGWMAVTFGSNMWRSSHNNPSGFTDSHPLQRVCEISFFFFFFWLIHANNWDSLTLVEFMEAWWWIESRMEAV